MDVYDVLDAVNHGASLTLIHARSDLDMIFRSIYSHIVFPARFFGMNCSRCRLVK